VVKIVQRKKHLLQQTEFITGGESIEIASENEVIFIKRKKRGKVYAASTATASAYVMACSYDESKVL
jgi:hypothetical protein